ncbi:MAG: AAA family ATPase [Coprococcus sp.]
MRIPFNPDNDINIQVDIGIKTYEGKNIDVPIEQAGTGMLQILQILAYVLYFEPKLLLLDEPDEHLHPNNQRILAEVLEKYQKKKEFKLFYVHIVDIC